MIRLVITDLDGTLVEPHTTVFLPGIQEALARLRAAGIAVVVATNQSRIGRGETTRGAVDAQHDAICAAAGDAVVNVYICPHTDADGCDCRKPGAGMLLAVLRDEDVQPWEAVAVGDAERDIEAARRAGVAGMRVGIPELPSFAAAVERILATGLRERVLAALDWSESIRGGALPVLDRIDFEVAAVIAGQVLARGGAVYALGNGGSAAQASHFAAELVGRFQDRRRGPLRVASLAADAPALTALANDGGIEAMFARQVEAMARPGDAVLAFTTSGKSPNVLAALHAARLAGAAAVAFTGPAGLIGGVADVVVSCPGARVSLVQEAHLVCVHAMCEALEHALDATVPHAA